MIRLNLRLVYPRKVGVASGPPLGTDYFRRQQPMDVQISDQ